MRAPLFLFLFLVTLAPSFQATGQRPTRPQPVTYDTMPVPLTRIEALLAEPDAVLIRDQYRIETRLTFGVTLDALVVTEAGHQSERLRGLRIELHDSARPNEASSVSLLDYEEAVALSRALGDMADLSAKFSSRDEQRSSDLSFSTVGGFAVGIHQTMRVQNAFLSSGFVDPVRRGIEIADLSSLKAVVDRALAVLADK